MRYAALLCLLLACGPQEPLVMVGDAGTPEPPYPCFLFYYEAEEATWEVECCITAVDPYPVVVCYPDILSITVTCGPGPKRGEGICIGDICC